MFKTLFTYLPFAFGLWSFLVFVLPCRLKVRAQAIWAMVLLLASAKFLCFDVFGGDAYAPELPEYLIWFWNWASIGVWFLVPLSVPGLLVPRRIRLYLLPALAWGLSAVGVYNSIKLPVIHEVTFESPRVTEALDGYRIAQISDLHASAAARRWRTEGVVKKANEIQADLIVVTGDIVDGHVAKHGRNVAPLANLQAKDGVFFCAGNHEYYFNWREWQTQYKKWNCRFLENEGVLVRPGLFVAGVTDIAAGRGGAPYPNTHQAFASETNGAFRLLLQHRPNFSDLKVPVDLQLSGHTHGGIAPGIDKVVAHHNYGFVKGFQPRDGKTSAVGTVYTSPGSGQWAGFPLRLFNDPEITVITLRRKKQ